jgi:hypothetical protein
VYVNIIFIIDDFSEEIDKLLNEINKKKNENENFDTPKPRAKIKKRQRPGQGHGGQKNKNKKFKKNINTIPYPKKKNIIEDINNFNNFESQPMNIVIELE